MSLEPGNTEPSCFRATAAPRPHIGWRALRRQRGVGCGRRANAYSEDTAKRKRQQRRSCTCSLRPHRLLLTRSRYSDKIAHPIFRVNFSARLHLAVYDDRDQLLGPAQTPHRATDGAALMRSARSVVLAPPLRRCHLGHPTGPLRRRRVLRAPPAAAAAGRRAGAATAAAAAGPRRPGARAAGAA